MSEMNQGDSHSPILAASSPYMTSGGPIAFLLFAILAFSSMFHRSAQVPSPPTPEPTPLIPADSSTALSRGVGNPTDCDVIETLKPLWEQIDVSVDAQGRDGSRPRIEDFQEKIAKQDIEVLIATLPDPVDTSAGHEFDMGLVAVYKAIESEGYVSDDYKNPWENRGASPQGSSVLTPIHRRQPACLVFRRADHFSPIYGRSELLVLLIVGESNGFGVQLGAMRTALECAKGLLAPGAGGRHTIKILGPTYSGTQEELAGVLSKWLEDKPDFDVWVCSGSATSVEKERFDKIASPLTVGESRPPRVIYASTVLPDELMLTAALEYLADPGKYSPGRMPQKTVLLVESGSHAGARLFRMVDRLNQQDNLKSPCTFIPFPRRLAQIREFSNLTQGLELNLDPKLNSSVPLAEKGPVKEVFPVFELATTQWSDGEVISHILSTITEQGARCVGIVASEIRNVIFLVHLINRHCPDTQVFLINNDLLFNYRKFAADFYGAIIASTYPLDSRAQVLSFPNKGAEIRRMFGNEEDIGRYNAGLVLLNAERDPVHQNRLLLRGQGEDLVVYGPPFADLAEKPLQSPRHARPCVWINFVGKNDTWPVRTLSVEQLGQEAAEAVDQRRRQLASETATGRPDPKERIVDDSWRLAMTRLADLAASVSSHLCCDLKLRAPEIEPPQRLEIQKYYPLIENCLSMDGDLAALRTSAENDGTREIVVAGQVDRAKTTLKHRSIRGLENALEEIRKLRQRAAETKPPPVELEQQNVATLLLCVYEYWKWAHVLGKEAPQFEHSRSTGGSEIFNLEQDLNRIGILCRLRKIHSGRLQSERTEFANDVAQLCQQVNRIPSSEFSGGEDLEARQRRAANEAAATLAGAALDFSHSMHAMLDYFHPVPDGSTEATGPQKRKWIESALSGRSFDTRWQDYRTNRTALDSAMRYLADRLRPMDGSHETAGKRGNGADATVGRLFSKFQTSTFIDHTTRRHAELGGKLLNDIKEIDKQLRGSSWSSTTWQSSIEDQFEALAGASARQRLAREIEELVPPVIDVEHLYGDVTDESRGNVPERRYREGSLGAILTGLPWLYQLVLLAWVVLAWTIAYRIFRDNLAEESAPALPGAGDSSFFSFAGKSARDRWVYTNVIILTLLCTLSVLGAPQLYIIPTIRWLLLGGILLLGSSFVAVHGTTTTFARRAVLGGFGVLWALLAAVVTYWQRLDPWIGAIVTLTLLTILMLILLEGWILWGPWNGRWNPGTTARHQESLSWWVTWYVVAIVVAFVYWAPWGSKRNESELFAATRLPFLNSGVSPISTALYFGAIFLYWSLNRISSTRSQGLAERGEITERTKSAMEDLARDESVWADDVTEMAREFDRLGSGLRGSGNLGIRQDIRLRWGEMTTFHRIICISVPPFLLVILGLPVLFNGRFTPTPEGTFFDTVFLLALAAYLYLYLDSFCRLKFAWFRLRRLLVTLDSLPFQPAISRLPDQVREAFGRFVGKVWESDVFDRNTMRRAERRYARELSLRLGDPEQGLETWKQGEVPEFLGEGLAGIPPLAISRLHAALEPKSGETEDSARCSLAWSCLPFVVASWNGREPRDVFGRGIASSARSQRPPLTPRRSGQNGQNGHQVEHTSAVAMIELPDHPPQPGPAAGEEPHPGAGVQWLELAEDFTLIMLVSLLKRYARPVRLLAAFLMFSPILLLMAITVYPFQPQRLLSTIVWTLVLAALGLASWVFIQIDRDPFVSRISGTTPNVATFDASLLMKLLPTLVPVIGLVVAVFPDAGFWLENLFTPIIRAIQ